MRCGDSELKGPTVGDVQQKAGHLELVAEAGVSNLGIVCSEQVKAKNRCDGDGKEKRAQVLNLKGH